MLKRNICSIITIQVHLAEVLKTQVIVFQKMKNMKYIKIIRIKWKYHLLHSRSWFYWRIVFKRIVMMGDCPRFESLSKEVYIGGSDTLLWDDLSQLWIHCCKKLRLLKWKEIRLTVSWDHKWRIRNTAFLEALTSPWWYKWGIQLSLGLIKLKISYALCKNNHKLSRIWDKGVELLYDIIQTAKMKQLHFACPHLLVNKIFMTFVVLDESFF